MKEKTLEIKKKPEMGYKEVLGRPPPHAGQKENGRDMELVGSGRTAESSASLPLVRAAGVWDI